MLPLVVVALSLVGFHASPSASPSAQATATRSAALEQKAQAVRGSHVDVWCEDDQAQWDRNQPHNSRGITVFQYQATVLAPIECQGLSAPQGSPEFDVAAYIFIHELMHTAGSVDEGETECWALWLMRYELRKNWGYSTAQAEVAWQRAWALHRTLPAAYQGTCAQSTADLVSVANRL